MSPDMIDLLIKSFWETCYMVFASTALSTLIGIPLGVILTVTRKDHILPNQPLNTILGAIVTFHSFHYINGSNYSADTYDCRLFHRYYRSNRAADYFRSTVHCTYH